MVRSDSHRGWWRSWKPSASGGRPHRLTPAWGNRPRKGLTEQAPTAGQRAEMRRITEEEAEWAYQQVLVLFELVARSLARDGEPELAAELRRWR